MKKILLIASLLTCQLALAAPTPTLKGSPSRAIAKDLNLTHSQVLTCLAEGKEAPPEPQVPPKDAKRKLPLPPLTVKKEEVKPITPPFIGTGPVKLNDSTLLACIKKENRSITQLQLDNALKKNLPNLR